MKFPRILVQTLLLIFCAISVPAQDIVKSIDTETYEQVLDIVMPMTLDENPFDFGYVIRVRPSNEAEYMIKLRANEKNLEMTKYESVNGYLFSYLSKVIEEKEIDDPRELARSIKIKEERKVLSVGRFNALRNQFGLKLSSIANKGQPRNKGKNGDGSAALIMHGTVYEIKFVSSQRENLSFLVYDYSLHAKSHDSEIVPWIKSVLRLFVEQ